MIRHSVSWDRSEERSFCSLHPNLLLSSKTGSQIKSTSRILPYSKNTQKYLKIPKNTQKYQSPSTALKTWRELGCKSRHFRQLRVQAALFQVRKPSLPTGMHSVSLTYMFVLSSHLQPCLSSGPFTSGIQTKILYAFFISPSVLYVSSIHYLSLRSKYPSQHPVFKTPSICVLSVAWETKFQIHKTNR
jgi:hypothetical protein